ncbi:tyrosine-type recombinase/integrase [Pigmentiphaga kullae]|uniref:Integrase n=1 Tax=Pigmentiphaga kullae TaxID=151784 RepID=A0A4Q7NPX2_9BURK|nr:site-specific integrase [Pigmentiphaga kullae]RZS86620.1 integrase [Pigmentiphaga kullae]
MTRTTNRLNSLGVTRQSKPGLYSDGNGLYLQVTAAGVKSWLFRYMKKGKARGMGLGPTHLVSLAEARTKALECRRQLLAGEDPLESKSAAKHTEQLLELHSKTFDECATAYIATHERAWKSEKHAAQWQSTLNTYASPVFGKLPASKIDTTLVMKAVEPIWATKTETASRLRGRIEAVLDWAAVRGYRQGENPARWKGHLDHLLPKRSKVQKVEHHPALPYQELTSFMKKLRELNGNAARALELLILTATRTSETIEATWDEVDFESKTWTIPALRMKAGQEHRVPLSLAALTLLEKQKTISTTAFVFEGGKAGKPLSNMALLQLLKRMGRDDLTAHGFRSTFRDWVGETTSFPRELAEAALAHTLRNKTEAAYARGDLLQKRAELMEAWSSFAGA